MQQSEAPAWEIGSYSDGVEVLKEVGSMGRFLFKLEEYPGLGIDAKRIRATMIAAPELLAALQRADKSLKKYEWYNNPASGWAAPGETTLRQDVDAAIAKATGQ